MLLGIDVGTTGTRAVALAGGRLVGQGQAPYPMSVPRPGWAEQDPADWWRATGVAVRQALGQAAERGHPAASVVGLGLTGQMHSLVALDARDRPLRPAILWCDGRTGAECAEIIRRLGGLWRLVELTANRALPGFTAPKILWMERHEPELRAAARRFLVAKDHVRLQLTGEAATDAAEASGTLLFDVAKRRWSGEMLATLGVQESQLPRVFEGTEVTGRLTADAAARLGLPAGVPVVGGGGDQAAGAVGAGVVAPGRTSVALGTSGVVLSALDVPHLDPHARLHMFCHSLPGRWFKMGVTLAAGGSLRWLRDALGPGVGVGVDYATLDAEAAAVPAGAEGLLFAPYLTGERTPHDDPAVRGGLLGLSLAHGRGHLVRAVMEGVAFSLRDVMDLLGGGAAGAVLLSGGGAQGATWTQILADVLGRPVERLAQGEGPALGAALLAGLGTGVWSTPEAATAELVRFLPPVAPGPEASTYADLLPRWRRLYPMLRELR